MTAIFVRVWGSMNLTTARSERSASQTRQRKEAWTESLDSCLGTTNVQKVCLFMFKWNVHCLTCWGRKRDNRSLSLQSGHWLCHTRQRYIWTTFSQFQVSWVLLAHHCLELHTKWNVILVYQWYILCRKTIQLCIVSLKIAMTDIWSSMENISIKIRNNLKC